MAHNLAVERITFLDCSLQEYLSSLVYKDYSLWVKTKSAQVNDQTLTRKLHAMMLRLNAKPEHSLAAGRILDKVEEMFKVKDSEFSAKAAEIAFDEGMKVILKGENPSRIEPREKSEIQLRRKNEKLQNYILWTESRHPTREILADLDRLEASEYVEFLQYQDNSEFSFKRTTSPPVPDHRPLPHPDRGLEDRPRVDAELELLKG